MAEKFNFGSPLFLTHNIEGRAGLRQRSWLIVDALDDPARMAAVGPDWVVIDLREPGWIPHGSEIISLWRPWSARLGLAAILPGLAEPHTGEVATIALASGANALLLSAADGGADVQGLDVLLRVEEARAGLGNPTAIVALLTAQGLQSTHSFRNASTRLLAIGIDDGEIRMPRNSDISRFGRARLVWGAMAAGVAALDSGFVSQTGDDLRAECLEARRNGFSGKLSPRADEVQTINEIF